MTEPSQAILRAPAFLQEGYDDDFKIELILRDVIETDFTVQTSVAPSSEALDARDVSYGKWSWNWNFHHSEPTDHKFVIGRGILWDDSRAEGTEVLRIVVKSTGLEFANGKSEIVVEIPIFDDEPICGTAKADRLIGTIAHDVIDGGRGNDTLYGDASSDTLEGGAGKDKLYGGKGADRFVFDDGDFVGSTVARSDRIMDFRHSQGDRIDFGQIDAIAGGRDSKFTFVGDDAFGKHAGELRAYTAGDWTFVQGDTDGNGKADFVIRLYGEHELVAADFVL